MNILCVLSDGPDALSDAWIRALSRESEVEVIDLARKQVSYDALVDKIFACDKLICW